MLKKTITFEDFNGDTRTEDFLFNLSRSEIMEMEMSTPGGWSEWISTITAKKDAPKIMDAFKNIILRSYGEKSADGREFIKSEELSRKFMQTNAYDVLFMELLTDTQAVSDFVNGITPSAAATSSTTNQSAIPAPPVQIPHNS